jgi:murein DD-endopeptidase MepM/ murein hydrolase activator NlpD
MIRYIMPVLFSVLLASATIYVKDRRAQRAVAAPAQSAPAAAEIAPANDREQWAVDFLAQLGNAQPSADTVAMVVEWTLAEDSGDGAFARNNPLNTTQPGFAENATINGDGVKGYADREAGLAAAVHTVTNGLYNDVVAALQANDAEGARRALWASPWAGSHYGYGASWPRYAIAAPAPAQSAPAGKKCPYTDTMAIGEGSSFYSTGSGYWSGQYGGMHLGDDFVGNPGDPVYAPFDMQIEMTGEYTDPGRFGKNIQARFLADHTLYYAGHLIDVYVSSGETVAACAVIGTLGATAGPHTHIKLASPDAPVPCEGSPPGPGGCIDPMEYWDTH